MEGTADAALIRQLGSSPKPLAMAAGAAAVLALLPGLPMLPFMALAGLAGGGAWLRYQTPGGSAAADEPAPPGRHRAADQRDACSMDMIRLELGYGLLTLAGGEAPRLTEQIKGLRRSIAAEMGFVLPPVPHPGQHATWRRPLLDPRQGDRGGQRRAAAAPCCWRWTRAAARRRCRASDARAGVRPAGAVDRSVAEGRGDVPRLHGGRSAQRADHAPDRGGAREHGGAAVLRRDAEAAG